MQVRTEIGETEDMDGGPFRSQRPAERRVASRPEPAYRQPEAPEQVSAPPKPVHRAASHHAQKEEKPFWKRVLWPIVVVAIALAGVLGWFAWSNTQSGGTGIDSSKYQAVFFANGQIYFGKLQSFNGGFMKLTDIFYLQSSDDKDEANPQATSSDQSGNSNMQLIKLGDEIHGPEDEMIIAKDQILYYENLKTDGKVTQSIKKFKSSGN